MTFFPNMARSLVSSKKGFCIEIRRYVNFKRQILMDMVLFTMMGADGLHIEMYVQVNSLTSAVANYERESHFEVESQ